MGVFFINFLISLISDAAFRHCLHPHMCSDIAAAKTEDSYIIKSVRRQVKGLDVKSLASKKG